MPISLNLKTRCKSAVPLRPSSHQPSRPSSPKNSTQKPLQVLAAAFSPPNAPTLSAPLPRTQLQNDITTTIDTLWRVIVKVESYNRQHLYDSPELIQAVEHLEKTTALLKSLAPSAVISQPIEPLSVQNQTVAPRPTSHPAIRVTPTERIYWDRNKGGDQ